MLVFVLCSVVASFLATRLRVEVNLVESAYVIQFVVINQSNPFVRSLEGMKMQKQNVRHILIKTNRPSVRRNGNHALYVFKGWGKNPLDHLCTNQDKIKHPA